MYIYIYLFSVLCLVINLLFFIFIFHFKMQRNSLRLIALLLIFLQLTYLLSASAIPATRTQNLKGQDSISALPSFVKMEEVLENDEEVVDEGWLERRVDLETQDYEGTGANRDHDPKSPGRF